MKLSTDEKRTQDETVCPQCGGIATWGYSDADETQVEVLCADCGRVEMKRDEFDIAETDVTDPAE